MSADSGRWPGTPSISTCPGCLTPYVLIETVARVPAGFAWHTDGFGVAAGIDERTGRYLGLVGDGQHADAVTMETAGLSGYGTDSAAAETGTRPGNRTAGTPPGIGLTACDGWTI